MKKNGILIAVLTGVTLIVTGCATSASYRKSPFLGRLSHYHRASYNPDILQFRKQETDLSERRNLALKPVVFYYRKRQKGARISDAEASAISTALTNSLADKLDGKFRLVADGDNSALVARLALVEILPPDGETRFETRSARIIPLDLSRARLEMKLLDSSSGKHPVAGMSIPVGDDVPTLTGGFTSWTSLEKAIDAWTTELAASLDDFSRPLKKDHDD